MCDILHMNLRKGEYKMKFLTLKASDDNYVTYTELNSIGDLIQFIEENGEIIFGSNYDPKDDSYKLSILVYDDYIE